MALTALLAEGELRSPTVGTWVPGVGRGAVIGPGTFLGRLRRARRWHDVLAPPGTSGQVLDRPPARARVEHGSLLVALGRLEGELAGEQEQAAAPGGRAILAAIAGTVYLRPSPQDPPFVTEGAPVGAAQTVALVEVMKTFTPLAAGQDGVLEAWLVADGDAVEEGQVLARLAARPAPDAG